MHLDSKQEIALAPTSSCEVAHLPLVLIVLIALFIIAIPHALLLIDEVRIDERPRFVRLPAHQRTNEPISSGTDVLMARRDRFVCIIWPSVSSACPRRSRPRWYAHKASRILRNDTCVSGPGLASGLTATLTRQSFGPPSASSGPDPIARAPAACRTRRTAAPVPSLLDAGPGSRAGAHGP